MLEQLALVVRLLVLTELVEPSNGWEEARRELESPWRRAAPTRSLVLEAVRCWTRSSEEEVHREQGEEPCLRQVPTEEEGRHSRYSTELSSFEEVGPAERRPTLSEAEARRSKPL